MTTATQNPAAPAMTKRQKYAWYGVVILTGITVLTLLHGAYLVPALIALHALRVALVPDFFVLKYPPTPEEKREAKKNKWTNALIPMGGVSVLIGVQIIVTDVWDWSDFTQTPGKIWVINLILIGAYCHILTHPDSVSVTVGKLFGRWPRPVSIALIIVALGGSVWAASLIATTQPSTYNDYRPDISIAHGINWLITMGVFLLGRWHIVCEDKP